MTTPTAKLTEREQAIAGLREFADFLEAHPIIPVTEQRFLSYVFTRERLAEIAGAATSWQKVYEHDKFFTLRKTFGSGAVLDVYTDRENVCRKVVKGTRVVPAAAEREEEIVEWECTEPLLEALK